MTNDEKCLFEKIRKGDETAFGVIYKRYVPRLFYFVHEYVPNREIAEDIIHDSLMTLWNKRSTLDDQTNLGAYLFYHCKKKMPLQTPGPEIKYDSVVFEISLAINGK